MTSLHQLTGTVEAGGLLFACESCGRRLAVGPDGALVVLDHGDRLALHRGSVGGVEMAPVTVAP